MLEEWLAKHCLENHKDKGNEARRILTKELPHTWWQRPIASITPLDCEKIIEGMVDRGHKAQALNLFAYMRTCFGWAVSKHRLSASPMATLSAKVVIGKRSIGDRVLDDAELRAVWLAAEKLGYLGRTMHLLMLTGARLTMISELSWSEIDLTNKVITIPASRMKMDTAFEIPLSPLMLEILRSLPHQRGGDFVFSMSRGRKPYTGFALQTPAR